MSRENVEVVRRAVDAVRQGDVNAFVALHHRDADAVPLILDIEGRDYRGHGAPTPRVPMHAAEGVAGVADKPSSGRRVQVPQLAG